jgi:predicted MPP superfamily phosphohydrolase
MKIPRLSRRKFIYGALGALVATPLVVVADAKWFEPNWLKIRRVRIGSGTPSHRLVHFTDTHHKGDRAYLETVVKTINSLSPDFVCFTGDIVEEMKFLTEALAVLSGIKSPMYGVPGNHDYWSSISFTPVHQCFNATGGAWLMDESRKIADGKIMLHGSSCSHDSPGKFIPDPAAKNILLLHYPASVKKVLDQKFDLVLAGHSHGGQVRIPFYGPLIVPFAVDEFDLGLYQTKAGPLYVNAGIGYIYSYNFRFNCRPEITVIEI